MLAFGFGSVPTKQGASETICTKCQWGDPSARKYTRARARWAWGEKHATIFGCLPATTHPTGVWSMATPAARTAEGEPRRMTVMRTRFIPAPAGSPQLAAAPNRTHTVVRRRRIFG